MPVRTLDDRALTLLADLRQQVSTLQESSGWNARSCRRRAVVRARLFGGARGPSFPARTRHLETMMIATFRLPRARTLTALVFVSGACLALAAPAASATTPP